MVSELDNLNYLFKNLKYFWETRSEPEAKTFFSWWQLSIMILLGVITHTNQSKLHFSLKCWFMDSPEKYLLTFCTMFEKIQIIISRNIEILNDKLFVLLLFTIWWLKFEWIVDVATFEFFDAEMRFWAGGRSLKTQWSSREGFLECPKDIKQASENSCWRTFHVFA